MSSEIEILETENNKLREALRTISNMRLKEPSNNIWIVTKSGFFTGEDSEFIGAYSTREKAEHYADTLGDDYHVENVELDEHTGRIPTEWIVWVRRKDGGEYQILHTASPKNEYGSEVRSQYPLDTVRLLKNEEDEIIIFCVFANGAKQAREITEKRLKIFIKKKDSKYAKVFILDKEGDYPIISFKNGMVISNIKK